MTSAKAITARFESICPNCEATIRVGDRVLWKRGERAIHCGCRVQLIEREVDPEQIFSAPDSGQIPEFSDLDDAQAGTLEALEEILKFLSRFHFDGHRDRAAYDAEISIRRLMIAVPETREIGAAVALGQIGFSIKRLCNSVEREI